MTIRHFIWKFLVLFDHTLTTARVLEFLSLENLVQFHSQYPVDHFSWFEALLGCADVKNVHEARTVNHRLYKPGYPETPQEIRSNPLRLLQPRQWQSFPTEKNAAWSGNCSLSKLAMTDHWLCHSSSPETDSGGAGPRCYSRTLNELRWRMMGWLMKKKCKWRKTLIKMMTVLTNRSSYSGNH